MVQSVYALPDTVRSQLFLQSFERHLRAENKSEATIYTYTSAVALFGRFLADKGMPTDPLNIKREHIESFIEHLLQGWKPATANNRYRGLQAYFKWLAEEGEIKESPMTRMHPPTIPENPPDVLSADDILGIFKACDGKSFEDRRDTAILRVLLDTGMRRAELAGITLENLDLNTGEVTIVGKGRRQRRVSLGKKAVRDLDRYLRLRSQHRHADSPKLWLGLHGPITPWGVYQVVVERAKKAGVKAYTHLFRHTNAHLWLQEGSEVGLMAHMGWRSRTMLQRYGASRLEERAREEHKRLSPGDRF